MSLRSYKTVIKDIVKSDVDALRDSVRDKSWMCAGIMASHILKNIDMDMWESATRAGMEVANEVDNLDSYGALWDTWTTDLAIIIPAVLDELKTAYDPESADDNAELLVNLLAKASVLASSIITMENRIEEAHMND